MGVPVVASEVSGIPEVVQHGTTGLLVAPDAPAALADAVAALLDDRALGQRLGQAARQTVTQHFDNDLNLRLVCQLLATHHEHAVPHERRVTA